MKEYKKLTFKTKEEWLRNRGIGGSDAAAIANASKWQTPTDIYNRLVLNKEQKDISNSRTIEGTLAEEHIRELWGLDHPKCKLTRPPKISHWLFVSNKHPLLTCTPDGLFKIDKDLFGLEIKDVELIKGDVKEMWESDILPDQYYFQVLHYMVVMNDLKGVCLNAHLKYFKFNEETNKWEFSHAIDKDYWIYREDVKQDIKYLLDIEINFIKENIEKKHPPKLIFNWR